MTEEEREDKMKEFVKKNQKDLKAFGWLSKMDESKGKLLLEIAWSCVNCKKQKSGINT